MFKDIREILTGKSASTAILRTHILVLILPIITSIAVQFAVGSLMQGEIRDAGFLVAENARNNFDNLIKNVEKLSKQLSINDSIAIMYHDGIRTNNYNLKDAIYTLNYICKSTDDIDDIFIYNKNADIAITTNIKDRCIYAAGHKKPTGYMLQQFLLWYTTEKAISLHFQAK